MAQYIYLKNDGIKVLPGTKGGLKSRVHIVDHFIVYEKEVEILPGVKVWQTCGGFGDPGDEIFSGGRCRMGVRSGNWVIDIELSETGFDGTENTDWKNVGEIIAKGSNYYWSSRYPSNLVATVISDTQIDLSWTNNGTADFTGISIERGTDGVNFSEIATVANNAASYSNTGLTISTLYYYRIRYYLNQA